MNIHRAGLGIIFSLIVMIHWIGCGEQNSVHPVIAFIRTGVWSIYKGPEIVVYDNGMVLFKKDIRRWPIEYSSCTLEKHEMDDLLASLRLFDTESVKDTLYNLVDADDLDEQWLVVSLPYKGAVGIYGDIPEQDISYNGVYIPNNILHLFHSILALKGRQSTQWSAEAFEVSVYSRTGTSEGEPVIEWSWDWPRLNDPRVMKLGDYGYRFSARGLSSDTLHAMYPELGKPKAVRIDSQLYNVNYRPLVPEEESILQEVKRAKIHLW